MFELKFALRFLKVFLQHPSWWYSGWLTCSQWGEMEREVDTIWAELEHEQQWGKYPHEF